MTDAALRVRLADVVHVARSRDASDIHIAPGSAPAIRVDGKLEFLGGSVLSAHETAAIAANFLDSARLADVEGGHDRSVAFEDPDTGAVRVHVFRIVGGVALAIRLLARSLPDLESLGLPPVVASFSECERGLLLFSGPTGSGKSTTLAALLDRINRTRSKRIITIEDPVEFRHASKKSSVAHREIGRDAQSFASALVGALRADPDVIVVGEMRDAATMRAALTAAETGHLVLATLHTGDAAQTIDRIVDAFEGSEQSQIRSQLAQVITGVVCQHLVARAHGRGRCPVVEVLVASDAVRSMIRDGRTHQLRNALATGRSLGMQTFEQHISSLLESQEIDYASARAASGYADEIRVPSSAGL